MQPENIILKVTSAIYLQIDYLAIMQQIRN